jgi:chromosome segregation ATPase
LPDAAAHSQASEETIRKKLGKVQARLDQLQDEAKKQGAADSRRIDNIEKELEKLKSEEQKLKQAHRDLEKEKDKLDRSQRILQAEMEDQAERLEESVEELMLVQTQMEDLEEDYKEQIESLKEQVAKGDPDAKPSADAELNYDNTDVRATSTSLSHTRTILHM